MCLKKLEKNKELANFLADHPCNDMPELKDAQYVALTLWKFCFDGLRAEQGLVLA
jgi:hypothetical protein